MNLKVTRMSDHGVDNWNGVGNFETDDELAIYAENGKLCAVYAPGAWEKVVVVDG